MKTAILQHNCLKPVLGDFGPQVTEYPTKNDLKIKTISYKEYLHILPGCASYPPFSRTSHFSFL